MIIDMTIGSKIKIVFRTEVVYPSNHDQESLVFPIVGFPTLDLDYNNFD